MNCDREKEEIESEGRKECVALVSKYLLVYFVKSKALQLCVELRVFLSEVPFLRESVVIYSYILVHQI